MSGPKCSELSPTEIEEQRQRVRQRAQSSLAAFLACEMEFRPLAERLVDLGERPPELNSGSQLRSQILDLINRGSENEAARLAEIQLAAAHAAMAQAGKQLERCVAALQHRHRQILVETEELSRAIGSLARFEATSDLPTQDRAKIAHVLTELRKTGAPRIPLLELSGGGIARLNTAEDSLKAARLQTSSSRHIIESILDSFHNAQLIQASKSQIATIQKLEEFLQTSPSKSAAENDPTLTKLEKLLSSMASFENSANWAHLMEQVEAVRSEMDLEHRRTVYEGLTISFNSQLRHLREVNVWRKELLKLLAQAMLSSSPAAKAIAEELATLNRAGRVLDLNALSDRLEKVLAQEEAEERSQRRRNAILESLSELGYEIEEGLATGLVQGGKLILRKADEDEYAIELVMNNQCSLVQTAVIRYAANLEKLPYQHLRDREREETWCRDYAKWQERLKDQGWNTSFKLKMEPGQQPVKTVVDQSKIKANRNSARKQTTRQRAASA